MHKIIINSTPNDDIIKVNSEYLSKNFCFFWANELSDDMYGSFSRYGVSVSMQESPVNFI